MEEYYVLISRNKSILKEPRNAEGGAGRKLRKILKFEKAHT